MAFDIFIQYLPRHVADYYTKLKSLTSKIQQTAGSAEQVQTCRTRSFKKPSSRA